MLEYIYQNAFYLTFGSIFSLYPSILYTQHRNIEIIPKSMYDITVAHEKPSLRVFPHGLY